MVVPLLPGQGRPPAPRDLDRRERRIWRAVVGALPAHWLDPAGQQVLRRLVARPSSASGGRRGCGSSGRRAGWLRGGRRLATLHSATAKGVAYLLSQLRATPRSRVVSRAAGPEVEAGAEIQAVGDQSGCLKTIVPPLLMSSSSSRLACSSLRASTSGNPLRCSPGRRTGSEQSTTIRRVPGGPS